MRSLALISFAFLVTETVAAAPALYRSAYAPPSDPETINLRYQIAGALLNSHTLEGDFAVGPALTVGPTVTVARSTDALSSEMVYERGALGVAAHYFLSAGAFEDGSYLKPFLEIERVSVRARNSLDPDLERTSTGARAGLIWAYQWIWSTGFNIHLGVGAQFGDIVSRAAYSRFNSDEELKIEKTRGPMLTGDLTLGWAF